VSRVKRPKPPLNAPFANGTRNRAAWRDKPPVKKGRAGYTTEKWRERTTRKPKAKRATHAA
jgi:hypothetical protein